MSPVPYYSRNEITIYHGDCLDVMPHLGQFDIAFTSPPYNMRTPTKPGGGTPGKKEGLSTGKWGGVDLSEGYDSYGDAMPMDEYDSWQRSVLTELWSHTQAIFYNHKPRPWRGEILLPLRLNPDLPLRQVIIWKRAGGINFSPSHYLPTHEWIMLMARKEWRLKSKGASGVGDVWEVPQQPKTAHPAPFPVELPSRALESTGASSIIDPFMGSGSTLLAALRHGVSGVGIDVSEKYCELAAQRLDAEDDAE